MINSAIAPRQCCPDPDTYVSPINIPVAGSFVPTFVFKAVPLKYGVKVVASFVQQSSEAVVEVLAIVEVGVFAFVSFHDATGPANVAKSRTYAPKNIILSALWGACMI